METKLKILFFIPFNSRSITLESLILFLKDKGHKVFLCSLLNNGSIQTCLGEKGVEIVNWNTKGGVVSEIIALRKICKQLSIDIVHSHLQRTNLIAVIANKFTKWKLLTVRHNTDVIYIDGTYKERLSEKIINLLSPNIIAISEAVYKQLIAEGVAANKITCINNGYDFSQYELLTNSDSEFTKVRREYNCKLLVVYPTRLIAAKRVELLIDSVEKLSVEGCEIKLLVLGEGPMKQELEKRVNDKQLQQIIFFLGHKENISDYIKAADLIPLVSVSEASNNVVKEAAYFEKNIIVCKEVGDFESYLVHKQSAYFISKYFEVNELVKALRFFYEADSNLFGQTAKKSVISMFDIQAVGNQFESLHKKLNLL